MTPQVVGPLVALAILFLATACSAQRSDRPSGYELCGRTGVYRNQAGVLRVCTPITHEVIDQIETLIRDDDQEILVTSDGGNQDAALRLAQFVRDRDLTVRVRQFCLSACSTYVLAMAPRGVVDPYTSVAFHHTAAWVIDTYAARANMPADTRWRAGSARERQAYRSAGLDDTLLDRIAMAVEPTCLAVGRGLAGQRGRHESRYDWYIPDRSAARTIYGDRVTGYWPDELEQAAAILRLNIGRPNARIKVGPLPEGQVSPEQIAAALPEC